MYLHFFKRLTNFFLSLLGIICLSPIFLVLAISVKIDSKGPVLFRQKRVGKDKTIFKILKFRTMKIDTPSETPTHMLDDPERYITKVGRFLRKTSLDELPQIFNILAGQMAIVGPRPALYNQDDLVSEREKYGANRLRPGLTGWAQINGRDELPIAEKAKLDGEYVEKAGFLFDLKIFFQTIVSVFHADGIKEGKTQNTAPETLENGAGEEPDGISGNGTEAESGTIPVQTAEEIEELSGQAGQKRVLIVGEGSYIGDSFAFHVSEDPSIEITIIDSRDDRWRETDFSGYDSVFLVAGIAHDTRGKKDADLYDKVNFRLAVEIAEFAKNSGVKQLIFMSSILIYNGVSEKNITAETKPKTVGCYAESKRKADRALSELAQENFSVAVVRPPMIFGYGCKGNFPRLLAVAKKTPIFPRFSNRRSMLYIENLCEFIRLLVLSGKGGVYFPQNPEYFRTDEIIETASRVYGKKIRFTKLFNFAIVLLKPFSNTLNKVFGNLTYEKGMSDSFHGEYVKFDNRESLERSIRGVEHSNLSNCDSRGAEF